MTQPDPLSLIDQRLTDLEIKASFSEDMVDSLNAVIVRQQQQIDALLQELSAMRSRLPEEGSGGAPRNLRDELPPHY